MASLDATATGLHASSGGACSVSVSKLFGNKSRESLSLEDLEEGRACCSLLACFCLLLACLLLAACFLLLVACWLLPASCCLLLAACCLLLVACRLLLSACCLLLAACCLLLAVCGVAWLVWWLLAVCWGMGQGDPRSGAGQDLSSRSPSACLDPFPWMWLSSSL